MIAGHHSQKAFNIQGPIGVEKAESYFMFHVEVLFGYT